MISFCFSVFTNVLTVKCYKKNPFFKNEKLLNHNLTQNWHLKVPLWAGFFFELNLETQIRWQASCSALRCVMWSLILLLTRGRAARPSRHALRLAGHPPLAAGRRKDGLEGRSAFPAGVMALLSEMLSFYVKIFVLLSAFHIFLSSHIFSPVSRF